MKMVHVLMASAFSLALGVAMSGPVLSQTKEWKEIRIGTEGAYPPYNNLNAKKELEGFEIDYMNDLCGKMKVKCTWVVQDWDGIIPALLSNKSDVIVAGMNATPERQKRVDFSDVYTATPIGMVGAKSITSTDISPAALKGKAMHPSLKEELKRHARRLARLDRVEAIAKDSKDDDSLARVKKLIEKENARHDKWMSGFDPEKGGGK